MNLKRKGRGRPAKIQGAKRVKYVCEECAAASKAGPCRDTCSICKDPLYELLKSYADGKYERGERTKVYNAYSYYEREVFCWGRCSSRGAAKIVAILEDRCTQCGKH